MFSGHGLNLCVVLKLNAIVTKTLPRVNANVTDIHSALASPGWMAYLVTMAMVVIGVPPLCRAVWELETDKTLHGSSPQHSHLGLTVVYIVRFCLKLPNFWSSPFWMFVLSFCVTPSTNTGVLPHQLLPSLSYGQETKLWRKAALLPFHVKPKGTLSLPSSGRGREVR